MSIPKLRGPNYNDYVAPVVSSWPDLDQRIDGFLEEYEFAPGTKRSHTAGWRSWEEFCATECVDPLDAPYSAFEGLLTVTRQDGHGYTGGTFDLVIAAIDTRYRNRGLTPAHRLPQNVADFKSLRAVADSNANKRKRKYPASHEQWAVAPLLIDHLDLMVNTTLSASPRSVARLAGLLVAWDAQIAVPELARTQFSDARLVGSNVRIGDREFVCDHRQRAQGVPWDCTNCALKAVLDTHSGRGPLFMAASSGDLVAYFSRALGSLRHLAWRGAGIDATSRSVRGSGPAGKTARLLTPEAGLSDYQLAGMRRACVLLIRGRSDDGLRWLRARAWVATAWTSGFRMCGDLLRLDRDAVVAVDGGLVIRLGGTKDDPYGSKRVTRRPEWSKDDRPGATEYLSEYLAVRDAMHGPNGALLTTSRRPNGRPDYVAPHIADGGNGVGGGTGVAKQDLALLTKAAGGLDEATYSSKSVRMGFATQLHHAEWEPEAIKDFLRHTTLDPVLNNYIEGLGPAAAAEHLMTSLEGRSA